MLPLLIAAIFPVLVIMCIFQYKIDAPYREQWNFLYTVEAMFAGELRPWHFWQQEAEHRHPFPYALMLLLARLTRWNITAELLMNVLLSLGTLITIAWASARPLGRWWPWFTALASLLVFSLAQFECWLWGFEMVTFLNLFSAVIGFAMLTRSELTWRHVVVALIAGTVSCYSFANGFVFWPVGLLIVFLRLRSNDGIARRAAAGVLITWCIVPVLLAVAYAVNYRLPHWSAPGEVVAKTPLRFLEFLLVYLGNPMVFMRQGLAIVAAIASIAIYIIGSYYLLRRKRVPVDQLLFFWALGAYVFISGMLTSAGRANFGEPKSPRYITTTCLFWVGASGILFQCLAQSLSEARHLRLRLASASALVIITALAGYTSHKGYGGFQWYYDRNLPMQSELHRMQDLQILKPLFPKDPAYHEMVGTLRANRLGIFREYRRSAD